MSRVCWTEPAPYANGHSPQVMFIDSTVEPSISPSPGGAVPVGWIKQLQAHDGSLDSVFQTVVPLANGGWPTVLNPTPANGGGYPLPPNPRVGAGL